MSDNSEDFALTPAASPPTRQRTRATLVQAGRRLAPSDGRFHFDLAVEYIRDHGGRDRWIEIGELARAFYGINIASNRERVRRRLAKIWHLFLNQGLLLVSEFGQKGRAISCKLYDPRSTEDRQYLRDRLDRMQKQNLVKAGELQRAIALAECLDLASNG